MRFFALAITFIPLVSATPRLMRRNPTDIPVPDPSMTVDLTTPVTVAQASVTAQTRRRLHSCDEQKWMKEIEAQAWSDAEALARVAQQWQAGKDKWQAAMNLFMGKDSVKSPYKETIRSGLDNEVSAHEPNSIFPEAVIDIYCGDSQEIDGRKARSICKKENKKKPGEYVYPFATTWINRGTFWNDYYMVLCPRFFAEKDSLFHTMAQMNLGLIDKANASAYKYTWGHTIYHELMHLDPVVATEPVGDTSYGACDSSKLADFYGPKYATKNAESWALFADTAYFQDVWGMSNPGKPDCRPGVRSEGDTDIWFDGVFNRTGDSFSAGTLPTVAPSESPLASAPTPTLPFNPSSTPAGLATPFADAVAWFASQGQSSYPTGGTTTPAGRGNFTTKTIYVPSTTFSVSQPISFPHPSASTAS
ncbi:hypothetical protein ANO14919_079240 [Xylariales sp. No.14919]|nr:hypothetical protein ANO14919_079240 [Xylariales sp. No.14919]